MRLTSPGVLLILSVLSAGGIFLLDVFYLQPHVDAQKISAFRQQSARAERAGSQSLHKQERNLLRIGITWSQYPEIRRVFLQRPDRARFNEFAERMLEPADVDTAWLANTSGQIVNTWSAGGGIGAEAPRYTQQEIHSAVMGVGDVSNDAPKADSSGLAGLITIGRQIVIFARQPIQSSDKRQIVGYLWLARNINHLLLDEISAGGVSDLVFINAKKLPSPRSWQIDEDRLMVTWPATNARGRLLGYFRGTLAVGHISRQAAGARRIALIILLLSVGLVVLVIIGSHMLIAGPVVRLLRRLQEMETGEGTSEELVRDLHGEPLVLARRLGSAFDRLAHMSKTDQLTGLSNRRHFEEVIECFYHQARRYNRPLSLIMLDIDFFKAINDTGGHQAGDELLKAVGRAIEQASRKADLPARFGGDEFAILLPETGAQQAAGVASRIRELVAAGSVNRDGLEMNVTISAGVADLNSGEIDSPDSMMRLADRALYAAKELGRNRLVQAHDLTGISWREGSEESDNINVLCKKLAGLDTQFKGLFLRAVEEIVQILERRDIHMADHARKVQRYAELIAKEMELPERVVKRIKIAATLHDIGMMAMPDSILLHPGKYDEQQLEVMRRHPLISVRIMEGMEFLEQEIPAVRYHHERYDGKGYPEGIAGAAIPITARILAVADAFDAMTSGRTFRRAKGLADAIEELQHLAGTQFDPAVLDAFLSVASKLGDELLQTPVEDNQTGGIVKSHGALEQA